ncbi:YbaB/EbfC family nucleoid-associated protein [Actinoplanes rectilineatus]|uniref:YbaB/EbfC family nucleoid-associated protein n=1 Tax=Actinoplanes rectilineatus TaxID=113571 RepID=UPI0005F2BFB6|nr:YbaB/EbfC family nucleoid-associated protein [Actinoplanes rectilineatus]
MRNVDEAGEWLDRWAGGVSERAARAAELNRRVAGLTGRASSRDGTITVVVAATGQVEDLRLEERVRDLPAREISREILAVMRAAQHTLTEQIAGQVRDTVGADSETGRTVLDAYARRFPASDTEADRGR